MKWSHTALVFAAGLTMVLAVILVFFYAPVEANMGIVQKIFYFHIASAYTMYLSWLTCTVASVVYLARRNEYADMLAASAGEIALLFAAIVMVTGPIWADKAWGAPWTWDPRLTSALLLTLIIISYVLLRRFSISDAERRFAAALSILGAAVVPLIHISVTKWRGQHPTVITGRGGGLEPEMWVAFIAALVSFTLLFGALLKSRYRLEKLRRKTAELGEEAALAGKSSLKGAFE